MNDSQNPYSEDQTQDEVQPRRARLDPLSMSNKTYDFFKWVVRYFLPGLGTLYFTIAKIWGLPAAEEVVGTIVAVTLAISTWIGLSNAQYKMNPSNYDGTMVVDNREGDRERWTFIAEDLDEMKGKKVAKFRVENIA